MPSSDMIFAVGPFTALPPINGLPTSDGTRRAWSAARSAGTAKIGSMLR